VGAGVDAVALRPAEVDAVVDDESISCAHRPRSVGAVRVLDSANNAANSHVDEISGSAESLPPNT
jgi:hypothetical protein